MEGVQWVSVAKDKVFYLMWQFDLSLEEALNSKALAKNRSRNKN